MDNAVHIRGLKEFDRALGKADKRLRTELRTKLKKVADVVAVEAKSIAGQRNKKDTGNLVSRISSYALTGSAGVRSNAVHRGYNYPNRLEYENRAGTKWGPRASVNPAVERKMDYLNKTMDSFVDDLANDLES